MDPNSSAWAYAHNRIVPTATGSSDDFQHPHLASISAASGTSAQSLLLHAAHSSIAGFNATSGNFVPPGPIVGYNPVFQQIYHHAAQAAVQPKPAHYASSTVNTPHRQIGLSGSVEKLENCRPQPAGISYSSNHAINLPTSSYYGDNSSSSGASPSPTTSATSSTTLSWNTPVVGGSQQMTANSFLTMNQHHQQDIHRGEKVTNSKQTNLHTKAHSKSYGDLIFVGNHEEQHEQVTLQLDNNRTINAFSEDYCNTFVDGKLTYNISAAAISSVTSLSKTLSASSVRVVKQKKQSSGDGLQPAQHQNLSQIPSPAYPIYESPSLCSSVGSPPPTVKSSHDNEGGNDSSHIIVYKSNTPAQQAQTSIDISTLGRGANSNNNRSTNYLRNGLNNNSLLPATGVAYSSVITNALQVNQQLQLHQQHDNSQHPDCWLGNCTNKLSDPNKHNQKCYSVQSPNVQENNVYLFPSSLQIKHTTQEPVLQNAESSQSTSDLQQQMINSALHIMSPQKTLEKRLSHQQMQPHINRESKHHSAENVLNTDNTVASQIQSTTKVTNSKQTNLHTKAHSKSYGDLIFVGNHEEQHEQVTLQLDNNRTIHAVSEDYCNRPEEGFYTFVDGKLTYNISAAAISSVTSLSNRLSASSVRVVTPKKQSSGDGRQPAQHQNLSQIPSPAYPIYESPSLCSSVGSPPPTVKSSHDNEGGNDSSHIIVYKSNTPAQQAQTSIDISTVGRGANSNNNRSTNYLRNGLKNNSLLPATGVAYSSVITNALQVNQQLQLHQQHDNSQHPDCWLGNCTDKLSDPNKHNQKCYSVQSPNVQENNVYLFPSSLQIKHTTQEPVLQNAESSQSTSYLQQQMINSALHIMSPQTTLEKRLSHQQMQPHINRESKHHSAENVLNTNNTVASQIQSTTKIEELPKPVPPKKTPRKRQPKKTLLTNNEYPRTSQQNNTQLRQQPLTLNQVTQQQQQTVQLQQQNGSFYDYNNRWVSQKIDTNTDISVFANTQQQQQQQTNNIPQPAHVHSNQTHPHISQYYPAFPQQVSTQYAACMSQNTNHYNLTPLSHDASQDQPRQQQGTQQSQSSLQQNSSSVETKNQEATESSIYKVIVPNIEDELHFLLSTDQKSSAVSAQPQNNLFYGRDVNQKSDLQNQSKSETSNLFHASMGKKSGFMDSYLKFLQGERDESPPPIVKSGRKFNYQKPLTQTDSVNSSKRKCNDTRQLTTTQSVADGKSFSPVVETSAESAANHDGLANDAHKIKIISQTQILPKKRPQAQNMAAAIQQTTASPQGIVQEHHSTQQLPQNINSQFRQNHLQSFHQDPLALPPRREQSLRKAKSRSINEIMQSTPLPTDRDEPEEFADSDADPVWTPQEDDSDDARSGKLSCKRKIHRNKAVMSTKKICVSTSKAGIENEDTKQMLPVSTTTKSISEVTSTSGHLTSTDNFKTGDFIVLRSDLVNDWPIIWQVDSKCILQKYEPFCQNGKMFYRNMSKYASWNLDTKKLYLKAPVRIQIQSHTETIVEFMRSELLADDTEQFIEKIMEDYLTYRDHFEIYIQTMISQVLDPSFFSEINREKDEYFLSSVRTIDEIMENCKRKLLSITPWTRSVIVSIETWPQCHVFTEWGQNNVNQKNCGGCHQPGISVRFLLFGHPYDTHTMQTIPVDMRVAYEKDILLCRICAARADIFHKIAHEKYNLFAICTRRVGEHQKEFPGKGSTEILNDLLAENNWVDELFRNMRSSWAEVESLERQKRFHEVSQ